jgi:hypothetical protein
MDGFREIPSSNLCACSRGKLGPAIMGSIWIAEQPGKFPFVDPPSNLEAGLKALFGTQRN